MAHFSWFDVYCLNTDNDDVMQICGLQTTFSTQLSSWRHSLRIVYMHMYIFNHHHLHGPFMHPAQCPFIICGRAWYLLWAHHIINYKIPLTIATLVHTHFTPFAQEWISVMRPHSVRLWKIHYSCKTTCFAIRGRKRSVFAPFCASLVIHSLPEMLYTHLFKNPYRRLCIEVSTVDCMSVFHYK